MKIKIHTDNRERLEDALLAVNGRAKSFTVTDVETLLAVVRQAEKQLDASGLPKAERVGAVATYRPAGPWAKSYRYAVTSTTVRLQRGAKDWFLVGASLASVYPRDREFLMLTINPQQRDKICAKALDGYRVLESAA